MIRVTVFALLFMCTAFADMNLIREVEKLRSSLRPKDPSRSELTLRLADLYFFEAVEVGKLVDLGQGNSSRLGNLRKKAVSLYQLILTGKESGSPAQGSLQIKVRFQLARLYTDLGRQTEANRIWEKLVEQDSLLNIKREAALRLAELAEKGTSRKSMETARKYYELSIELCENQDLCAYSRYRNAWVNRNLGNLAFAIEELQKALWDSKGQIREEALRDLIVFLAAEPTSSSNRSLDIVEELSKKLNRPELILQLANAFYSAGNAEVGTQILELVQGRSPSRFQQMRLLEQHYALRNWDRFDELMSDVQSGPSILVLKNEKLVSENEVTDSEKLLRRLAIQFDGERMTDPKHVDRFLSIAEIYVRDFPENKHAFKMVEGWLAGASQSTRRIQKIQDWLEYQPLKSRLSRDEEIRLREMRSADAQNEKMFSIVVEEMTALINLAKSVEKKREYQYLKARSLYELEKYDEALPIFVDLAALPTIPEKGAPPKESQWNDKWLLLSQNLALDILGQKKDYQALMKQVAKWTSNLLVKELDTLKTDLSQMQKVSEEAEFEYAIHLGQSDEALSVFEKYCYSGKFTPKSCENTQTLAVQLNDQNALFKVLEHRKEYEKLIAQYEATGYFEKSARWIEKVRMPKMTVKEPQLEDAYKLALLYELAGKLKDRDRWLAEIISVVRKQKEIPNEVLFYRTMMDANLIDQDLLTLNWSPERKNEIARFLEETGAGNRETKKILLSSKDYLGPNWSKYVLETVVSLDEKQEKIKFYGSRSKRKFERRMAALKKVEDQANIYLNGADLKTRVELISLLEKSYRTLAQEVTDTPLPEGLGEEALLQIKASLAEMASPFVEKAGSYRTLMEEQVAKAGLDFEPGSDLLDVVVRSSAKPVAPNRVTQIIPEEHSELVEALNELHENKGDVSPLEDLRDYYKDKGHLRISSYYEGRVRNGG